MTASITITLEVKVSTQKNDKVAVTGAHEVLGCWDPNKLKFLKPRKSLQENDVWFVKIYLPLSCEGLHYRYLVCRKFNSAYGDDAEDAHIIRHWESGVHCRYKTISELGVNPSMDTYGVFDASKKMFVDQGWLMEETEIQLRFYNDPIHMFKKRDKAAAYNVKCSSVNLLHDAFPRQDSCCSDQSKVSRAEELFDQVVHASNPLIRVSSLGHYRNKEQSAYGMSISSNDFIIHKLRTNELDSHGIKVDFYVCKTDDTTPVFLGYTNILPLHLERGSGSLVLAISGSQGIPIGHVRVRYLVCKPMLNRQNNLEKSFTLWWSRHRPTLEIGHRGLGNTHHSGITCNTQKENIEVENTLGSLIKAGQSGADFVEFDVMLSKDKVPIIWHDFRVSILLRKRAKGQHRVYHIPVHELSYSQLQDLRVDFVKEDTDTDHSDVLETAEEVTCRGTLSPFPTLKEALEVVDDCIGFYVELKYPQYLYENKAPEDGIESYFDRNTFLDAILDVLYEHASNRRIVLASFDPDTCIMARMKQNRYPVIMLVEETDPLYYHDVRTHSISTAIAVATSEKLLGLSVNAAPLLDKERSLLEKVFAENLICFVWGAAANQLEVRDELKKMRVHAICHDEVGSNGTKKSVLRAEHEEKLQKVANVFQQYSTEITPDSSLTGSPSVLSPNGSTEDCSNHGVLDDCFSESHLALQLQPPTFHPNGSSAPRLPVGNVAPVRTYVNGGSPSLGAPANEPSENESNGLANDYSVEFY